MRPKARAYTPHPVGDPVMTFITKFTHHLQIQQQTTLIINPKSYNNIHNGEKYQVLQTS